MGSGGLDGFGQVWCRSGNAAGVPVGQRLVVRARRCAMAVRVRAIASSTLLRSTTRRPPEGSAWYRAARPSRSEKGDGAGTPVTRLRSSMGYPSRKLRTLYAALSSKYQAPHLADQASHLH